jgi:hypothetical protein
MELTMLHYLLPALLPSWRFFDYIGPSPRIEICLLQHAGDAPSQWQPFRPPPPLLTLALQLRSLLWNPRGNEALYLLSSSEKLLQRQSMPAQMEIVRRIDAAVACGEIVASSQQRFFVFRLLEIDRDGDALQTQVSFESPVFFLSRRDGGGV